MLISNNHLKIYLKNEYFFSVFTKCINFVCSLVQSTFLARFLGAELRGTSAYINSILSTGSIIFSLGINQMYPYLKRRGRDKALKSFNSMTFLWSLIFGCLVSVVSLFMGRHNFDVVIALNLIPLMSYTNTLDYVLLIDHPNMRNGIYSIFAFLEMIVAMLIYFLFDANYQWMVFMIAYIYVIKAIILSVILKVFPIYKEGYKDLICEFRMFGLFPMIALLLTSLNYNIDVIMLRRYTIVSLADIGVYSIGIMIADKLALIADTLKGVLASKLARDAGDIEVAKVCRISFFSCSFLCGCLLLMGKPVVGLLYGSDYEGAYVVMIICSIGCMAMGYFKLIGQYNIINRKQKYNVYLLSISIITNVIGNIVLVPLFGINGAAVATSIAHIICGIVFITYFVHITSVTVKDMFFLKVEDFRLQKKRNDNNESRLV